MLVLTNFVVFACLRYNRCMFELPLHPTSQSSGSQQYISLTPVTISPFSRWDEITNEKVKPSDRPVVLNRASSTNTTNPFGSTFCYGYQVGIEYFLCLASDINACLL